MKTLKDNVIEYLKNISGDVTAEEIIEFVFTNQKLLEGEQNLIKGRRYTHEEAKEILEK
jgi:hypothetical protein